MAGRTISDRNDFPTILNNELVSSFSAQEEHARQHVPVALSSDHDTAGITWSTIPIALPSASAVTFAAPVPPSSPTITNPNCSQPTPRLQDYYSGILLDLQMTNAGIKKHIESKKRLNMRLRMTNARMKEQIEESKVLLNRREWKVEKKRYEDDD